MNIHKTPITLIKVTAREKRFRRQNKNDSEKHERKKVSLRRENTTKQTNKQKKAQKYTQGKKGGLGGRRESVDAELKQKI